MKQLISSLFLLLGFLSATAQKGTISGTVYDEKRQPAAGVIIEAKLNGMLTARAATNESGKYTLKSLSAGHYELHVQWEGYKKIILKDITVASGRTTYQNFNLQLLQSKDINVVEVEYKKPLLKKEQEATMRNDKQLQNGTAINVNDVASLSGGTYQQKSGNGVSIGGARTSGTLYIIDGVQLAEPGTPPNGIYYNPSVEEYEKVRENDFRLVTSNPLSTMSVDVDRASYSNVRRYLNNGQKPPADAVRIEEMINYFTYNYSRPQGNDPIAIATELTDCPWNSNNKLLRIGMQAQKISAKNLPASNLVFLIDVSGSMSSPDKLPLVISSLKMLTGKLRSQDRVAIVVYAGNAGLVLPSTSGAEKNKIIAALERLEAGGSTAGGAGIQLAYKTATENFIEGGNNRVILATDGDFNVGLSGVNELEDLISRERKKGIFLTCLGYGMGNYKDNRMETLADKGNGNYAYIDDISEAQKTLVHEFGGTLFTVAKDVKAQIEFNPSKVQAYRLVGYENRLLNEEDFKDDKKDAGDMGSDHQVTILYEIISAGVNSKQLRDVNNLKYQSTEAAVKYYTDEFATVKFRYKKPDENKSKEMTHIIHDESVRFNDASDDTRFASVVAMFGMLLRDSKFLKEGDYEQVLSIAKHSKEEDREGYRTDFIKIVRAASAGYSYR